MKQRHQVVTFSIAVLFPKVPPLAEFTSELQLPVDPNLGTWVTFFFAGLVTT